MQYLICSAYSPKGLEKVVDAHLIMGWKLQGGVSVVYRPDYQEETEYYQSLYDDEPIVKPNLTRQDMIDLANSPFDDVADHGVSPVITTVLNVSQVPF